MKKLLFLTFLFFGMISNVEAVSLNTNVSERLNKGNTIQIYKNSTLPNYTSYICRKIQNTSGTDDVFIPLKTETEFQAFLNNSPAYLLKNICEVITSCTPNPSNSTVYTATSISQTSGDGVNWSPSNVSYHSNTSTTTTCAYRCNPGYFYNGSACPSASPGYYAPGYGNTSQTACTPGNYQSSSAQTSCMSATPGYYVPGGAATSQTPASPGYYVSGTSQTSQTACTPGNYQPSSGQTSCINSTPGYYVPGGAATNQIACSAGTYQPSSGQSSCISASTGYYVPSTGQTSQTACTNKPSNSNYTSSSGLTSNSCPWSCNSGYHDESGICVSNSQTQIASCSAKPSNSYWNSVSSITQTRTWNGSSWNAWIPTISTTYSASASTTTCQYGCNSGYQNSGASCVPANCSSTSLAGYSVGSMLHGGTTSSGRSYGISNGTMNCTQGFSCSFGTTSTSGGESCSASCNSGYTWNGSSCEFVPVPGCWAETSHFQDMSTINSAGYPTSNYSCDNNPSIQYSLPSCNTANIGELCEYNYKYGTRNYVCKTAGTCGSAPVVGECGASNGGSFGSAPTTGLCNSGSASSVSGSGPWSWTCNGSGGGSSASCSATYSPSYTYSWSTGSWGSCSANPTWSSWSACSGGTQSRTCNNTTGSQSRTVQCLRNDGNVVADSNCTGVKPSTSQSCSSSCSGSSTQSCVSGGTWSSSINVCTQTPKMSNCPGAAYSDSSCGTYGNVSDQKSGSCANIGDKHRWHALNYNSSCYLIVYEQTCQ